MRRVSGKVQQLSATADVVVAEGQAYFETLAGTEREVLFLLKARCPVVARALGVEVGAAVLRRRCPAESDEIA